MDLSEKVRCEQRPKEGRAGRPGALGEELSRMGTRCADVFTEQHGAGEITPLPKSKS